MCFHVSTGKAQQLDNYIPTNLAGYDVMPGVTVKSRLRPEYDPLGIRFGETTIFPSLSQSIGYDDNLLGASAKHGSLTVSTAGAVKAASTSARSNLALSLDFFHLGALDLPTQSYTNWSAGGGWSHEIGRDTVAVGFTHFNLNQLPIGIDSIGLAQPLPYQVNTARLGYVAERGPWILVPRLDFAASRFGETGTTGISGRSSSLDRNVETMSLTTFYQLAPQRSAVFVIRGTTAQYTSAAPSPDYTDVSALAGFDYNTEGALRFRALVGYEIRNYRNAIFQNHGSPVAEGTIIWTPTGVTTLSATVSRRIEDANEAVQTGYTYTLGRFDIDHEYRRNVILHGTASVQLADYLQTGDRQTLYTAGIGATYLVNRNVSISLTYDFLKSSAGTGVPLNTGGYTRNVILLRIGLAI